jgi:histone H3/H4
MKKIARDCNNDIRFQSAAIDALQKTIEAMLINCFESKLFYNIDFLILIV